MASERLNVHALVNEAYDIVNSYLHSNAELGANYANYVKEAIKRTKRAGPYREPPLRLPEPLSFVSSTVSHGNPEETPLGTKPGKRPARNAALRARHGVAESYKLMSLSKLRRPSNFDQNKGFQPMPTIAGTPAGAACSSTFCVELPPPPASDEDIFRRPALPPAVPGPSRSNRAGEDPPTMTSTFNLPSDDSEEVESRGVRRSKRVRASKAKRKNTDQETQEVVRKSRAQTRKRTMNSICVDTEAHSASRTNVMSAVLNDDTEFVETLEKNELTDTKTRTKTPKKDKPEATLSENAEFVEPLEPAELTDTKPLNKTRRKNKPEVTVTDNNEFIEPLEPEGLTNLKSRTKTLRKNKPEVTVAENNEFLEPLESGGQNDMKTRTKTLKTNKPEAMITDDTEIVKPIEPDGLTDAKTRTKTLRKNKPEVTVAENNEFLEPLESGGQNDMKTRTKTLKTNKPEAMITDDTEIVKPIEPDGLTDAKTRTKTLRKNKPEVTVAENNEFLEPLESGGQNDMKTRTKTLKTNKPEAMITDDTEIVKPIEPDGLTDAKTRTKTLRKNKPEVTVAENNEFLEPLESGGQNDMKTRTKTLKTNKPEAMITDDTEIVKPIEPDGLTDAKTRTKTLRKNKPAEEDPKLDSTFSVAVVAIGEPQVADIQKSPFKMKRITRKAREEVDHGNLVSCSTLASEAAFIDCGEKSVEYSSRRTRSLSDSRNPTVTMPTRKPTKVSDAMDTLELPVGMESLFAERGVKRPNDTCDIRCDKRHKSGELTVDELANVVQNVPRTRSKMKALAESRSRSADTRTPGQGKENAGGLPVNFILGNLNSEKKQFTTPLTVNNKNSPACKTTGSSSRNKPARFVKEMEKPKLADVRRKEEEALKKKQELIEMKKKEIRSQRETKAKKVADSRAAVEKEKLLQLEKEKREREEKERQAKAELMKQKEEAIMKKRLLNQQKAQEAEERRQREEQLRLAKLREQEEEQRKAAEARQRQVEEAERLAALRKLQQKEEEQARLLEKTKEKAKPPKAAKQLVDPDDYGIDDQDGEEQETNPRRPIPKWAYREVRTYQLSLQSSVAPAVIREFFNVEPRKPNLREIFGKDALIRPRTSSAVWATPPPPPHSSL